MRETAPRSREEYQRILTEFRGDYQERKMALIKEAKRIDRWVRHMYIDRPSLDLRAIINDMMAESLIEMLPDQDGKLKKYIEKRKTLMYLHEIMQIYADKKLSKICNQEEREALIAFAKYEPVNAPVCWDEEICVYKTDIISATLFVRAIDMHTIKKARKASIKQKLEEIINALVQRCH
ncbi:hypothetical protein COT47_03305 [Candidatus Woesearchaeota archaeon CG08_land_8_20_14_0_20_43_7]|nr:MAG: hypothetical protein COT47_03305 [Candidatus Woesearchaeota archaeon CG08_land_8_20_14_0_20_43_7]